MSRTTTRRPGRLRALAVVSALAVSMIAGAAAPALAEGAPDDFPGSSQAAEVLEANPNLPFSSEDGDDFGTTGWSWF